MVCFLHKSKQQSSGHLDMEVLAFIKACYVTFDYLSKAVPAFSQVLQTCADSSHILLSTFCWSSLHQVNIVKVQNDLISAILSMKTLQGNNGFVHFILINVKICNLVTVTVFFTLINEQKRCGSQKCVLPAML